MARPPFSRNHTRRIRKGNDMRSRVWQAIRILREFDVSDLMAVCEVQHRTSILNFCRELTRAGYLAQRWERANNQPARYRLLRNTGPESPCFVRKRKAMWDMNTGEEFPL